MSADTHEAANANTSEKKTSPLGYKTHLYGEKLPTRNNFEIVYTPVLAALKLDEIRSPIGMGVYASGNENFAAAHFTRDGTRVAEDLLMLKPEIAEETILTAVRFQATSDNPDQDALSGAYHHEYRSRALIEKQPHLSDETRKKAVDILGKLGPKWGGTVDEMAYYGARDVTPLVVRLVAEYDKTYPGKRILEQEVQRKDGERVTVRESMKGAVSCVVGSLLSSERGLLEYKKENQAGIDNQYWKDSATSLLFRDGTSANHKGPIAEISIQAVTFDALQAADTLLTPDEKNKIVSKEDVKEQLSKAEVQDAFSEEEKVELFALLDEEDGSQLKVLAKIVQKQVLKKFWMEDEQFFAPALDRDPDTGASRQVDTLTSNPVSVLSSGILEDLSEEEKQAYVVPTVRMLLSPEFVTDAGIRCAAVRHESLLDFSAYHWSHASWPKDTEEFAQGLDRYGFYPEAEQMRIRMINAVNIAGDTLELFYVDGEGRVNFDPHGKQAALQGSETQKLTMIATNRGEENQAWTDSSILRAEAEMQRGHHGESEGEVLRSMPKAKLLKTEEEILEAYPRDYYFLIDTKKGKELDAKWNPEWHKI